MSTTLAEIRKGAYYDSVVLMQLQRALLDLDGVADAGVVMATPANKDLLAQSDLLTEKAKEAGADDLILVVRTENEEQARAALAQVDELLSRRRSQVESQYRPRTLDAALNSAPDSRWVLISVPGRYAADVCRQALDQRRNVFLYSDNVSVEDEIDCKRRAANAGLLVMGPDCGTAIVGGVGLGFANRVRRGSIGIVAASGTGLQAVSVAIHRRGAGVSQAIGTGGRDLSLDVGAIAARQALELLAADGETEVIVLISKPPSPPVAAALLDVARSIQKPVVVNFIGMDGEDESGLHFAATLDESARIACELANHPSSAGAEVEANEQRVESVDSEFLRALYSGGTLAYEALHILNSRLHRVYSNIPLSDDERLENPHQSREHTVVDLGEDEFTVGRLHPMMDHDLRIRRLLEEAEDEESGLILLDVVLGDGAHPDPAAELGPAIEQARDIAKKAGRTLPVFVVVVGTDLDPQGLERQVERLEEAGARVFLRNDAAVRAAADLLSPSAQNGGPDQASQPPSPATLFEPSKKLSAADFQPPLRAINVGLESFSTSLSEQGAEVVQMDWRPPAGGNDKLMGILARMKGKRDDR